MSDPVDIAVVCDLASAAVMGAMMLSSRRLPTWVTLPVGAVVVFVLQSYSLLVLA